jgi:hypothetical protein
MAFAVDISGVPDSILEFAGYYAVEENDEFKVYRDKFMQDHVVQKARPYLYVDELDEAQTLAPGRIVVLGD